MPDSNKKPAVSAKIVDNRPYWKVIVSLAFSLIGTALVIYLGYRGIFIFMPLVLGWLVSYIASPLVNWLSRRIKIAPKISTVVIVVLVLGLIVFLLYLIIGKLIQEASALVMDLPNRVGGIDLGFTRLTTALANLLEQLPKSIQDGVYEALENFEAQIGTLIQSLSQPAMTAAGNIAKAVPSILIGTIVMFLSAYFFTVQRDEIITAVKQVAPGGLVRRMSMIISNLKKAMGGYIKAQIKIMGIILAILLLGLGILKVSYFVLIAILIALLDFLPLFGTGTVLIPWALYDFLVGDIKMGVGLLITYVVTQLVRQLVQAKLVGDSMGVNPLLTLVLLYAGYKFAGVAGMIFAVPIAMIVINLYKAGAFDYILDDVKIIAQGIMNLRKQDDSELLSQIEDWAREKEPEGGTQSEVKKERDS
ncbi:MAG: sporulation integral membrane protein YtvI [Lachnospiraceae bacterium]|nr:sporulation integral membrane protein YtvI [Lachnospiraceae bacterium]